MEQLRCHVKPPTWEQMMNTTQKALWLRSFSLVKHLGSQEDARQDLLLLVAMFRNRTPYT